MKLIRRMGMVAGMFALLAACSEPTAITGDEMELEMARRKWDAQQVDDYRMQVRLVGAWFGGAAVIHVRNGVPVSVEPVGNQSGAGTSELWSYYDTVEELFAVVERAVEEDAYHLDATFNARYGLPVDVFVDQIENAVDDEHGFIVETFDEL
jgi:hypothetical protein